MVRLVADVGGTNTRIALSDAGRIITGSLESYRNEQWSSLYDVMETYLDARSKIAPAEMVLAIAGPVDGDHAALTNRIAWQVSAPDMRRRFGAARVAFLNDLTALGYAVPHLRPHQVREISAGAPKQTGLAQSLVVGIGTGFNTSPVLERGGLVMCPAVEAGHVGLPPRVSAELELWGVSSRVFATVEHLFSGRGFTQFCRAYSGDETAQAKDAATISGQTEATRHTPAVEQYSKLLGWLLRELMLSYLPASGIYLAGSVARAIGTAAPGPCLEVLHRPAPVALPAPPPVRVIEDDSAALLGCVGYATV
jgi:glucokinase